MLEGVARPCRRNGLGRGLVSFSLVLALALPAGAAKPPAHVGQSSEPAGVASRLWAALLTHCGDTYFYSGSVFDSSGMLSDVQRGHSSVMEYRGVRFTLVPIRVTDAERANGLTARVRIAMIAHLYREGGGQWRDGPDLRPRNVDDMVGQALSQANADMFDMGGSGSIAIELVKFKGQWAAVRSSTTMSGPNGFRANYYDVEKLIAVPRARYSCAAGQIAAPPPTPAEVGQQRESARRAAEAAKAAAVREEAERRQRAEEARAADVREQREAQFRFSGSPGQFSQALTANLAKRAAEFGFDPGAYRDDIDAINKIVATCMTVTIKDWVKAEGAYRAEKEYVGQIRGLDPGKNRAKILKNCDGWGGDGLGERISGSGKVHGLGVTTRMTEFSTRANDDLPMGNFFITVRVLPTPADLVRLGRHDAGDLAADINVIDATIPLPDLPGNR